MLHVGICTFVAGNLGEPASPMSQCKSKGIHYFVKDRRHGFTCLICGMSGDLDFIKRVPCNSAATSPPPESNAKLCGEEAARAAAAALSLESTKPPQQHLATDEALAQHLRDLEFEQHELEQMLILQQLEKEEAILAGLVNEQKALATAEKFAQEAVERRQATPAPNPAKAKVDPKNLNSTYGLLIGMCNMRVCCCQCMSC